MRPEDLRIYQASELLMAQVDKILRRLPPRLHKTADHLDRSVNSVHTNISEGLGIYRPRGKANAYAVARKEAQEVRGALRATVIRGAMTQEDIQKPYDLADVIIAMLTVMIKNLEDRA